MPWARGRLRGRRRPGPALRRRRLRRRDLRLCHAQRRRHRRGLCRNVPGDAARGPCGVSGGGAALAEALVRWGHGIYFGRVVPLLGRLVAGQPAAYAYLPASAGRFPPPPPELAAIMRGRAGARSGTSWWGWALRPSTWESSRRSDPAGWIVALGGAVGDSGRRCCAPAHVLSHRRAGRNRTVLEDVCREGGRNAREPRGGPRDRGAPPAALCQSAALAGPRQRADDLIQRAGPESWA